MPAGPDIRRRLIRAECPSAPGVYGMIDRQGELIYVGKSKSLRDRLLSYCSAGDGDKAHRILVRACRLVWERAADEFAALLRELELIRHHRPAYNVQGRPERLRRPYLCLGRGPASQAYLAERPTERADAIFGPLPGVARWREAVRQLNDTFTLRDCPDRVPIRFADQRELFPLGQAPGCMRHALGTCQGPCAAFCTERDYAAKVRAAIGFLSGKDVSLLPQLEEAMRDAASRRHFERAAAIRNTWAALDGLSRHLRSLEAARRDYSFVYRLRAHGGGETWYLLRHGVVAASTRGPHDPVSTMRCRRLLDRIFFTGDSEESNSREDLDVLLLVQSWFRARPDELQRILPPDAAKNLCR